MCSLGVIKGRGLTACACQSSTFVWLSEIHFSRCTAPSYDQLRIKRVGTLVWIFLPINSFAGLIPPSRGCSKVSHQGLIRICTLLKRIFYSLDSSFHLAICLRISEACRNVSEPLISRKPGEELGELRAVIGQNQIGKPMSCENSLEMGNVR